MVHTILSTRLVYRVKAGFWLLCYALQFDMWSVRVCVPSQRIGPARRVQVPDDMADKRRTEEKDFDDDAPGPASNCSLVWGLVPCRTASDRLLLYLGAVLCPSFFLARQKHGWTIDISDWRMETEEGKVN